MVLNPDTGHVSPQLHVVFDENLSTVTLMREVTILPNWTDLVQRSSQSGAYENINLKDTFFTKDLKQDPRETPRHEQIISTYN